MPNKQIKLIEEHEMNEDTNFLTVKETTHINDRMQRNFLYMHSFGRISEEISIQDMRERSIVQALDPTKMSPPKISKGSLAQQIKEVISKNPKKMEKSPNKQIDNLLENRWKSSPKIINHPKKLSISSKVSRKGSPNENHNYKENEKEFRNKSDLKNKACFSNDIHSVEEKNSFPTAAKDQQKLDKINTISNNERFPLKEANMNQSLIMKDSFTRKNSQDKNRDSLQSITKKLGIPTKNNWLSHENHTKTHDISSSQIAIDQSIENIPEDPRVEELVRYFEAKLQQLDVSSDNLDSMNMLGLSDIAPFGYIDPQELSAAYSSKILSIKETGCPKQAIDEIFSMNMITDENSPTKFSDQVNESLTDRKNSKNKNEKLPQRTRDSCRSDPTTLKRAVNNLKKITSSINNSTSKPESKKDMTRQTANLLTILYLSKIKHCSNPSESNAIPLIKSYSTLNDPNLLNESINALYSAKPYKSETLKNCSEKLKIKKYRSDLLNFAPPAEIVPYTSTNGEEQKQNYCSPENSFQKSTENSFHKLSKKSPQTEMNQNMIKTDNIFFPYHLFSPSLVNTNINSPGSQKKDISPNTILEFGEPLKELSINNSSHMIQNYLQTIDEDPALNESVTDFLSSLKSRRTQSVQIDNLNRNNSSNKIQSNTFRYISNEAPGNQGFQEDITTAKQRSESHFCQFQKYGNNNINSSPIKEITQENRNTNGCKNENKSFESNNSKTEDIAKSLEKIAFYLQTDKKKNPKMEENQNFNKNFLKNQSKNHNFLFSQKEEDEQKYFTSAHAVKVPQIQKVIKEMDQETKRNYDTGCFQIITHNENSPSNSEQLFSVNFSPSIKVKEGYRTHANSPETDEWGDISANKYDILNRNTKFTTAYSENRDNPSKLESLEVKNKTIIEKGNSEKDLVTSKALNKSISEISILTSEKKNNSIESPKVAHSKIDPNKNIYPKKSPHIKPSNSGKKKSYVFLISSNPENKEIPHQLKKEDAFSSLSSNFSSNFSSNSSPNSSSKNEKFDNNQNELQINLSMIKRCTEKYNMDDYTNKSGRSTNLTSQREINDSSLKSPKSLNQSSQKFSLKLLKNISSKIKKNRPAESQEVSPSHRNTASRNESQKNSNIKNTDKKFNVQMKVQKDLNELMDVAEEAVKRAERAYEVSLKQKIIRDKSQASTIYSRNMSHDENINSTSTETCNDIKSSQLSDLLLLEEIQTGLKLSESRSEKILETPKNKKEANHFKKTQQIKEENLLGTFGNDQLKSAEVIPQTDEPLLSIVESTISPKFQQISNKNMKGPGSNIEQQNPDKPVIKALNVRNKESNILEIKNRRRSQSSKQRTKTQEKLIKQHIYKRDKSALSSNENRRKLSYAKKEENGIMNHHKMNYRVFSNNNNVLNVKTNISLSPQEKISPTSTFNFAHQNGPIELNISSPAAANWIGSPKIYHYGISHNTTISEDLGLAFEFRSPDNPLLTSNFNEGNMSTPSKNKNILKSPKNSDRKFSLTNSIIIPNNFVPNIPENSYLVNQSNAISDGIRDADHIYAKIHEERKKLETISLELNHIQESEILKYTNPFDIENQRSINKEISEQIDFQMGDPSGTLQLNYNELSKNTLLMRCGTNSTNSFNYTQTLNAGTRVSTSDNGMGSIEFKISDSSYQFASTADAQKAVIFERAKIFTHIKIPEEKNGTLEILCDSVLSPREQKDTIITKLNITSGSQGFINQELIDKMMQSYNSPMEENKTSTYYISDDKKFTSLASSLASSQIMDQKDLFQNIYRGPFFGIVNEDSVAYNQNLTCSIEPKYDSILKDPIRYDCFHHSLGGMDVDLSEIRQDESPNPRTQSPIKNQILNKYRKATMEPIHEIADIYGQSILYKSFGNIESPNSKINIDNNLLSEINKTKISPNKIQ